MGVYLLQARRRVCGRAAWVSFTLTLFRVSPYPIGRMLTRRFRELQKTNLDVEHMRRKTTIAGRVAREFAPNGRYVLTRTDRMPDTQDQRILVPRRSTAEVR